MTTLSLYQLSGQYLQLAERLESLNLDEQTVADTIEASGLTDEIAVKAQGIEYVARAAEMYCPTIEAEIARLQSLKAHRQKIAMGLRDYLKRNMEATGIEKIECPFFKFSIKKNPPAVDILDEAAIPESLKKVPEPPDPKPDKAVIKKLLQAGEDVPGAVLRQGTRLHIA